MFFGRTDAKAETPKLWPPHVKSWLIGKDSDAGRDWRPEEKGTKEDEMAEWHHQLDGRESEWTPGDGDEQEGLGCCDLWGCKESDMTEQLNWTELKWFSHCVQMFFTSAGFKVCPSPSPYLEISLCGGRSRCNTCVCLAHSHPPGPKIMPDMW